VPVAFTQSNPEELGICPLTRESVESYQKAELRRRVGFWGGGYPRLRVLIGIALLMATIVAVFACWISWKDSGWAVTIALAFAAVTAWLAFRHVANADDKASTLSWQDRPFDVDYDLDVPEKSLAKAVAIKMRLPEAEFSIEELVEGNTVFDPFLRVRLGKGDWHYVDVYAESKFEATL